MKYPKLLLLLAAIAYSLSTIAIDAPIKKERKKGRSPFIIPTASFRSKDRTAIRKRPENGLAITKMAEYRQRQYTTPVDR